MLDDVRASVVVVTHNSEADIVACLESIQATLGPRDEVLVYDSGSTDRSVALSRSLGVRTIAGDNLGYGGANNRGAALTRGDWLVFLNPDTVVEPGWLDALLAPLANRPGLSTPKIELVQQPGVIDTCGNQVHLSGITTCRGFGQPVDRYGAEEQVAAVSGAAFAIDRRSFSRLGGFDERFFMYLEDTDLSLRARVAGLPIWYAAASRVRHRHAPSFAPRKLYWLERNRYLMLAKVWSTTTLLSLVPMLLLTELLVWGYVCTSGPNAIKAKADAWRWLLSHPWRVAAARRTTQSTRTVDDGAVLALCSSRLAFEELIASRGLRRVAAAVLALPQSLALLPMSAQQRSS